jgi:hypothetical protein
MLSRATASLSERWHEIHSIRSGKAHHRSRSPLVFGLIGLAAHFLRIVAIITHKNAPARPS